MIIKNFWSFLEGKSVKEVVSYLFSKRLMDILNYLKENDTNDDVRVVADFLLKSQNSNQVEDDITFIDLSDREGDVSFIQVNRILRLKGSEKTFSNDGTLAEYIDRVWKNTKGDLNHEVWKDFRTNISIGRFLNRVSQMAKISIMPAKVEKFSNSFKARAKFIKDPEGSFQLVRGDEIKKWYLEHNYENMKGQLSASCMRYDKCQDFFDIYTKNPEVCGLLILKGPTEEKISGRALVWELTDGRTYMDRQYCNEDSDMNLFKEYAIKKGWIYYPKDNKSGLTVKVTKLDYKKFPYMDTFYIYNHKDGFLTSDERISKSSDFWKLTSTDGSHSEAIETVYSDYLGEDIPQEDAVYCRDINDWNWVDNSVYLEYKDIWVTTDCDDLVWSDFEDASYFKDDCVWSNYVNSYLLADEAYSVLISSTEEDYVPSQYMPVRGVASGPVLEIEIDGEEVQCITDSVMLNTFTDKFQFKKDGITVYMCPSIGEYLSKEDAQSEGVEIGTEKKRVSNFDYYQMKVERLGEFSEGDIERFIEWLADLEPTEEMLEKIEKIRGRNAWNYFIFSKLEEGEKFGLIKLGVLYGYRSNEMSTDFGLKTRVNRSLLATKEKEKFLKFISEKTYEATKSSFERIVSMTRGLQWDIIKDPEMIKIYQLMMNTKITS